ncbi:hypothetical protein L7F22_056264 [Adiantum nelumboides]|nr:hypothetical protein [Adiantum nelumboides]
METLIQVEEGGGDKEVKLPAEVEGSEGADVKLQKSSSGVAEIEVGDGLMIAVQEGGAEEAIYATPTNVAALGSSGENEQLALPAPPPPLSYATTHTSDGGDVHSAQGEDKKLQYTLRSNPKRSRRFLDPDYSLELQAPTSASPSAALPTSTSPAPASSSVAPAAPIKKGNSLFSEKARACTECGKQFPSWKALFGHMRCHPERQWRGIQPPTSISTLRERPTIADRSAAAASSQPNVECPAVPTKALASSPPTPSVWDQYSDSEKTIKARVPAGPKHRPSDYDAEESDTESIEAAYMNGRDHQHHSSAILHGSGGGGGHRFKRPLQDVELGGDGLLSEANTPPDEVMEERDMADCLVMLAFAAKSKADESDGDSALLNWKTHVQQSPLLSLTEARKPMELKEKRSYNGRVQKSLHFLQEGEGRVYERWENAEHDKGSWDRKSRFECSTCKKTFRSHQALGGHRASHKKVKGCFARTNAAEEGARDTSEDDAELSSIALTMATVVEEQCQREEDVLDTNVKQATGDQEEQGPSPAPAPLPGRDISMGQFLQFSISCSEKMEDDQSFESAIAPEKLHLKAHQTSSCSSSSSVIAATAAAAAAAAAGTLTLHHHHSLIQQLQQPKIHQCSICNRVFSTGQALGGHKRCHWGGSSMPETGRKCPLMRQDSDGMAPCTMGIAMSDHQRTPEFSRKGRQDSGSFTSDEAWMNISLASTAMETHMSGLSNKGRQDSVASCDHEVKVGQASANSWLGGNHLSCEKDQLYLNRLMMVGRRRAPSQEHDEGIVSAQRGWLEASSSNPVLGSKNQLQNAVGGGYKQQGVIAREGDLAKGEAGYDRGRDTENIKGACECSRGGLLGSEDGGGGQINMQEEVLPALMKMEEVKQLDLNLPAPAEEEERAGDALPRFTSTAAPSNWLSSKEGVAGESSAGM